MLRTVLALVAMAALLPAQKKPVTLELLNNPRAAMGGGGGFPGGGGAIWAPQGARYVHRAAGKMMLFDVASKTDKELFDYNALEKLASPVERERAMGWENRRVSERPTQWSADGKHLLLSVGGDLFLYTFDEGKVQQITNTPWPERDPKLSPDSTRISYRRDKDLYTLEVASKKITRLTHDGSALLWNGMLDWVYPEELDLGTAYWWSPDSKSIAYMQFDVSKEPMYPHADFLPLEAQAEPQRYPKAGQPNADVRLGVVSAAGGRTKWMNLGDTRDHLMARVYWAPDSRWLAVFRLNRVQDKLDIMRAEVESGQGTPIIQEHDPYWININDDFQFLQDGSIVWTSERDNFRHIYRHRASGAPIARVTFGDWEVTSIACVDESARKIYYISSETSPLERNLYVVGFDGKDKQRLTQGAGTHSVSMSPACDYYTDAHSSLESPSRTALYKSDGTEVMETVKPNRGVVDEYDIRPTEIHTVKGPDGTVFYGRLIKPSNFDPAKKYPAVVSVYGGPHAQSVRNAWAGGVNWDQVLANKGFVIWQMDNRGSSGRGHHFEAALYRRFGHVELQDQKLGVEYLVGLGFVDPKRIGITGWSYGGYMTLYAMLHAPDVFAAGVAGAAVTDFRNYDTIYTERYLGLPAENEEGYDQTAPVKAAKNLKGKLLIVHNIEDDNVLWANAVQMANALQLARKPFEMQYYAWKAHGLGGQLRPHYVETATKFFEDALKP